MNSRPLFILILLSTSLACYSEPSNEVLQLLKEPVSLFEKGIQDVRGFTKSAVSFKEGQVSFLGDYEYEWKNTTIYYAPETDTMHFNFSIESEERENLKKICTGAVNYLRAVLVFKDPHFDLAIGSFFLPYRLKYTTRSHGLYEYPKYTEDELKRARHIDSIARFSIVVSENHNPHSFIKCEFRINDDDIIYEERIVDPHNH